MEQPSKCETQGGGGEGRGTSSTFKLRVPPLIGMEVNSNSYLYGPTFQVYDSRG